MANQKPNLGLKKLRSADYWDGPHDKNKSRPKTPPTEGSNSQRRKANKR